MDHSFLDPASAADPYGGVELGVECAWPSAEWQGANREGTPGWEAQYTVSTGTPNT